VRRQVAIAVLVGVVVGCGAFVASAVITIARWEG
jgi:hypothetical protein